MNTMKILVAVIAVSVCTFVQMPVFAVETATKQPTVITPAPPGAQEKNAAVVEHKNMSIATATTTIPTITPLPKDTSGITFPDFYYYQPDNFNGSQTTIASSRTSVGVRSPANNQNLGFDASIGSVSVSSITKPGPAILLTLQANPKEFRAVLQTMSSEVSKALALATKPADRLNLTWIKTSLDKAIKIASQYIK